jgi:hypothetical protein
VFCSNKYLQQSLVCDGPYLSGVAYKATVGLLQILDKGGKAQDGENGTAYQSKL